MSDLTFGQLLFAETFAALYAKKSTRDLDDLESECIRVTQHAAQAFESAQRQHMLEQVRKAIRAAGFATFADIKPNQVLQSFSEDGTLRIPMLGVVSTTETEISVQLPVSYLDDEDQPYGNPTSTLTQNQIELTKARFRIIPNLEFTSLATVASIRRNMRIERLNASTGEPEATFRVGTNQRANGAELYPDDSDTPQVFPAKTFSTHPWRIKPE